MFKLDTKEESKDVEQIIEALKDNGYYANAYEAVEIWCTYSAELCASWLFVPDKKEDIWGCIKDVVEKENIRFSEMETEIVCTCDGVYSLTQEEIKKLKIFAKSLPEPPSYLE